MKEIVVYMENEWVEKKCRNVLMKVPKCWKLVVEGTLGWPHFVKLANDMEWYVRLKPSDRRVFDGIPINTLEGSLFLYEWKSWMAGSAIGNCASGAYAVGVRSEDSAATILNRIVHELIHGIDKNGQCNPDCMLKIPPEKWLSGWKLELFKRTGDPSLLLANYKKGSTMYWVFWHLGEMLRDYWQGLFYEYLVGKYMRGECDEGIGK